MLRRVSNAVCLVGALLATAGALAQSSDPNSSASSPQDRVSGGAVRARAPGLTVQAAITRHTELTNARVNAARGGGQAGTSNSSGSGSSTSSSGLGSLTGLLGQLGLGDSLSGLASLIPGVSNTDLSTLGQGTLDAESTTTNSSGDATDPRLAALLALKNGSTSQDVEATSDSAKTTTRAQTNRAYQYGGGFSRLTKYEDRAQTTSSNSDSTLTDLLNSLTGTTTDPNNPQSFRSRLLAGWSTAFFGALTYGFSQTQFQTLIKNILTPLILPRTTSGDSSGTETSGNGTNTGTNTNTGGNTGGNGTDTNTNTGTQTGTGGGIETLTEPTEETKTDSTL